MGYDSDHPKSHGEVGKCGVAVDSLRDMEILLDGIDPGDDLDLDDDQRPGGDHVRASTWRTPRSAACRSTKLRGTLQNDILKEYIAQKCWCFPPRPALRIIVDLIEFATKHVPQWNTISISGYHIREAGSTAAQELAFTLADGFTYVEECLERGLDVDDVRAAAVVLLEQPPRLLRGDRQAARRAPHLGAPHARALQAKKPESRG